MRSESGWRLFPFTPTVAASLSTSLKVRLSAFFRTKKWKILEVKFELRKSQDKEKDFFVVVLRNLTIQHLTGKGKIKQIKPIRLLFNASAFPAGSYDYTDTQIDDQEDVKFLRRLGPSSPVDEVDDISPSDIVSDHDSTLFPKKSTRWYQFLFFPIHWAYKKYDGVGLAVATLLWLAIFMAAPLFIVPYITTSVTIGHFTLTGWALNIAISITTGLLSLVGNMIIKKISLSQCCRNASSDGAEDKRVNEEKIMQRGTRIAFPPSHSHSHAITQSEPASASPTDSFNDGRPIFPSSLLFSSPPRRPPSHANMKSEPPASTFPADSSNDDRSILSALNAAPSTAPDRMTALSRRAIRDPRGGGVGY